MFLLNQSVEMWRFITTVRNQLPQPLPRDQIIEW